MNCVWEEIEQPDAEGKRRVRCVNCGYVTRTATAWPLEKIHGVSCGAFRHIEHPNRPPGPGWHLKAMLATLGAKAEGCGGCNNLAAKMDDWGPDGCREHKSEIVAELQKKYNELPWLDAQAMKVRAVASGLAFSINPLDVCGSLVDEAIRRSALAPAPPGGQQ